MRSEVEADLQVGLSGCAGLLPLQLDGRSGQPGTGAGDPIGSEGVIPSEPAAPPRRAIVGLPWRQRHVVRRRADLRVVEEIEALAHGNCGRSVVLEQLSPDPPVWSA